MVISSVNLKLNSLNMCSNTVHHRSAASSSSSASATAAAASVSFNGIVDPFPLSTFHFLRTCNRLIIPTDLRPYYNFTKTDEAINKPSNDCFNENNKTIISNTTTNLDKSNLYSSIHDLFSSSESSKPQHIISTQQSSPLTSPPTGLQSSSIHNSQHSSNLTFDFSNIATAATTPTNDIEYPSLGSYNRLSTELNYTSLMNRRQRGEKRPIPDEQKDEKYYERRKRNNEAAKKSRDARKLREDRIAFRAAILEQENAILRAQLIALREEMTTMRQIMGTRPAQISVNL